MLRASSRQSVRGIARLNSAFLAVLPAANKPKALSARARSSLGRKPEASAVQFCLTKLFLALR